MIELPWRRRGAEDIASASRTRRPGFESRQGMRFLGKHSSAVVYTYLNDLICIVCVLKKRNKGIVQKIFLKIYDRISSGSVAAY
jgi:hypothetical protein